MTVAIATKCEGGAVLIVDKNIILSDGSKLSGKKYYWRYITGAVITLVSSTDDGVAAECLANQILDALEQLTPVSTKERLQEVCKLMQEWYASYAPNTPPGLNYLMIISQHNKAPELFLLEPPRSFLSKHCFAIGSGARVAQPILEKLIHNEELYRADVTMMYLTYMAKRAEAEEAFIGGGFDGFFIPVSGPPMEVSPYAMFLAEETIRSVNEAVGLVLQLLMSLDTPEILDKMSNSVCAHVKFVSEQLAKTDPFPYLKAKPSASQKLAPEQ